MIEEWRPIEGYEGLYEVSNLGAVRNVRTGNQLSSKTYGYVKLYKNCDNTTRSIGFLVGTAFVPGKTKPNQCIIHKDGNKSNNRADNLEWGLRGPVPKKIEVWRDGELIAVYSRGEDAAEAYSVTNATIWNACTANGKIRKLPGLIFKYEGDKE